MKKLFSILLLYLLTLTVLFPASANIKDEPFVLVLDAGHGGKDPGAIGKNGKEKNINLAVTLLAGKYIAEKYPDVKIIYTREKDVFRGLNERANIANKANANLFISIHTNSSDYAYVHGLEVYTFGISRTKENLEVAKRENSVIFLEENYEEKYEGYDPNSPESFILFEFMQNKFVEQSINFASTVRSELKTCVKWRDRGIKQAEYLVLRRATMPRILIELDFITNAEAEKNLLSEAGQKKYARAICSAFTKFKTDYDRKNKIAQPTQPAQPAQSKNKNNERTDIELENRDTEIDDSQAIAINENNVAPKKNNNKATTNKKTVYKVQILASPKKLSANSRELKGYKADFYVENNLYKYTYGESTDKKKIMQIRKSLLKDFKDAFIITFEGDVKVQNK